MYITKKINLHQSGFSLIELMVGLVIGLLATLAIMETLSQFEGQKRTTAGTADTQVNGNIALYTIQRQVQMAGYGLPIYDANTLKNDSPLRCSPSTIDHDANAATAKIDLFPIAITDGGGASDQITVRYFPNPSGGLPVNVITKSGSILGVDNTLGCADGNLALVVLGTTCNAGMVNDTDLATDTTHITLAGPDVASMTTGPGANYARLSCLGNLTQQIFRVNNNQLEMNNSAVISDVVNIQAQYGISASANSNQITQWVDATAATGFATPSVANRNRIRAVRVAVVARNSVLEKTNVTTAAPAAWPNVPVGGAITVASPAPSISLTATANWQQYRYRVYETIIPLRNMTWSGQWL
jgi:type IV pilus assembly protein PilW